MLGHTCLHADVNYCLTNKKNKFFCHFCWNTILGVMILFELCFRTITRFFQQNHLLPILIKQTRFLLCYSSPPLNQRILAYPWLGPWHQHQQRLKQCKSRSHLITQSRQREKVWPVSFRFGGHFSLGQYRILILVDVRTIFGNFWAKSK